MQGAQQSVADTTAMAEYDTSEAKLPRFVLRSQLQDIENTNGALWKQTPERAEKSRALLNGDLRAPIAKNFAKMVGTESISSFIVDTPQKYLRAYHQRNTLSKYVPRLERLAFGDSEPLQTEATTIEQIMQAVMEDKRSGYKWRESVDILQNESVALSITLPSTASMARTPSLYDYDDTKTDPSVRPKKTVKERYQRDSSGKTREQVGRGFRVSPKASSKVMDAEKRAYLSRHAPVMFDVLGPTCFIPVFGPGLVLDAVLVKRWWTITECLRASWIWDGMDKHLSPGGSAIAGFSNSGTSGGSAQIEVTELYAVEYDDEGRCHPYVAYYVPAEGEAGKTGGQRQPVKKRTTAGDGESTQVIDCVIDLYEEYGLQRLPCTIKWGPNWAHPQYDKKGMPFPLPFAQSDLAIDAILTASTVWCWFRGFPILIEQPSAGTPPDFETMQDTPDNSEDEELEPFSIIRAKGQITELGTVGPSAFISWMVEYLSGANREVAPPDAAMGGGGESGFQASLARSYSDDALDDIRDGALELFSDSAEIALEILSGVARKWGPVPIQRVTPVPLGKSSQDGRSKREILELTADLAGGIYDLIADYPPVPNLAKGQQWAEWASMENPLVLIEEFRREIIGDEHPEVFLARRLKQRVMNSPEMLAKVMAIAAQLSGDEEEKAQLLAMVKGKAEQGQDGQVYPTAPGAMLPPPGGAPMGQNGVTGGAPLPNPAQQALAGVVGGPIGAATTAAAAGGVVPPDLQTAV